MQLPLVTVITPTYNRADYLPETIESVLNQDYPNIEYLILDDGSTDDTETILEEYAKHDRIIIDRHKNMGEVATVNKGYRMAKGDYITIVNSDDPVLPGFIRTAVEFMESHPELLVTYPDWDMIDRDSKFICNRKTFEYDYLHMLRTHYCVPGSGAMISRRALKIIPQRDPRFRYSADYDYWLQIGLHGQMARIPATLATFRVHPNSATVSLKGQQMVDEHIALVDKVYKHPDLSEEILGIRKEAYASAQYIAGAVWLETDTPHKARSHFIHAIRWYPALLWRWPIHWKRRMAQHLLPTPVYHTLRLLRKMIKWVSFQFRRARYKFWLMIDRKPS